MLTLTCTVLGAVVLVGIILLLLTPVLLGGIVVVAWLVASLLLAWLGIEVMAALERWFENDRRFHR